jgi:hypothetical protein
MRLPIAVVQGAESEAIQQLFTDLLRAPWRPARIAGVIEVVGHEPGSCGLEVLRSIADGRDFSLFQDLGAGATGCTIDPSGVAEACAAVCQDIAAGCDLVVLSKFAKLEAENGSGLMAAFVAALEAGVPILTAVSPARQERWDAFAAPYYETLAAELGEIAEWWDAQSPATQSSATASSASR